MTTEQVAREERAAVAREEVASLSACVMAGELLAEAARQSRAAAHPLRRAWNEISCPLLEMLHRNDVRQSVLNPDVWGLVGLWRLRAVSSVFRTWVRESLSTRQLHALGGVEVQRRWSHMTMNSPRMTISSSVRTMGLASLTWEPWRGPSRGSPLIPLLPTARYNHTACATHDGRLVVAGGDAVGENSELGLQPSAETLQLELASGEAWSTVTASGMHFRRRYAASVALPDGRVAVFGGRVPGEAARETWVDLALGRVDECYTATAEVLDADGSSWSLIAPMPGGPRGRAAAAVLPNGMVIVAGGSSVWDPRIGDDEWAEDPHALASTEIWNPVTNKWIKAPDMEHARSFVSGCMLPSGRFVVLGGLKDSVNVNCEVFNPVMWSWSELPQKDRPYKKGWVDLPWSPRALAACARPTPQVAPVPGGFVMVGGGAAMGNLSTAANDSDLLVDDVLYCEESEMWFVLPNPVMWGGDVSPVVSTSMAV